MDKRGQFTFYRSFWEAVNGLPKKDRLPILEAIISYALDGTDPNTLTQSQFAFFLLVKPTLDSSRKKAANGKQGGKTPKASSKQSESKSEANGKHLETEKEKEKEKEIEIESEIEKEKKQAESTLHSGKPFTAFWDAYPKKIDREGAWDAWKNLNPSPDTAQQILASLEVWKKSPQWTEDGDRFVPNAAKFLSQGYWQSVPKAGVGRKANAITPSGNLGEAELSNIRRLLADATPVADSPKEDA